MFRVFQVEAVFRKNCFLVRFTSVVIDFVEGLERRTVAGTLWRNIGK